MRAKIVHNDTPAVFVWNKNIDAAFKLLCQRTGGSKSFKEIRKPRKSETLRQQRQNKRLRMYINREVIV